MKKMHHLLLAILLLVSIIIIIVFKLYFNAKITNNNISDQTISDKPDKPNNKETELDQFFNKLISNIEEWNNYQAIINEQEWNINELDIDDQKRWNENLETLKILIIELINNFLVRKEK